MVKAFFLPFLLLSGFFALAEAPSKESYLNAMTVAEKENGNYKVTAIDDTGFNGEFRIYHYDNKVIDEIADGAFSGTTFTTLGLTNSVKNVNSAFEGTNISYINFTGSEEEYKALNIPSSIKYACYAIDEGFLNYWNLYVRPEADSDICEISKETFYKVSALYKSLSDDDLNIVNATTDKGGAKIKDSMKELNRRFASATPSQQKEEWNQRGAITLIIVIAVIGMTSITIFFLLKTKKIIQQCTQKYFARALFTSEKQSDMLLKQT